MMPCQLRLQEVIVCIEDVWVCRRRANRPKCKRGGYACKREPLTARSHVRAKIHMCPINLGSQCYSSLLIVTNYNVWVREPGRRWNNVKACNLMRLYGIDTQEDLLLEANPPLTFRPSSSTTSVCLTLYKTTRYARSAITQVAIIKTTIGMAT